MDILEQFQYVIKHKKGKLNIVVYALSRRHALFSKIRVQILGFEHIVELYSQDSKLSNIFANCHSKTQRGYYVFKGFFVSRRKTLYSPRFT